jgi:CRP-like cAMP-binding protein
MPYPENGRRNHVLDCLSDRDFELLKPSLESVPLAFRMRLQSSNRAIRMVYFPESGLGSIVAVGKGREAQAEVGLIGQDGMTGIPIVHGTDRSPYEVFIQVEGVGQRISAVDLRGAMEQSPTMRQCFLLYAHVFGLQCGYTALANARGKLEERLARWLLMARDRLDTDELVLTHEFLSLMLGVRRAGVGAALQAFEGQGLIRTARGAVTILDRDGLEEAANGFYGQPEAEFERLFGSSAART